MDKILTILLFFIYSYGLGYSVTRFWKGAAESHLMRLGFGLGVLTVLGVVLNALHIPLDWRVVLILSVIIPVIDIFRKSFSISFHLSRAEWGMIILFILNLFIYIKGSFGYPWLEDSDPWFHAAGAHYVALEQNFHLPYDLNGAFRYINPYPPGFDFILGVLHQTCSSIYFVMKFFNALIASMSYVFFYYMLKAWRGSEEKALFSTFCLSCIPCFLTHFIWAHTLAITLFFVAIYGLLKAQEDKQWIIPSGIVLAAIALSTPTQALKLAIMIILWLLVMVLLKQKGALNILWSSVGGVAISLIWWLPVGLEYIQQTSGASAPNVFSPQGGYPTYDYGWEMWINPQAPNFVANPVGVGAIIMLSFVEGVMVFFARWSKQSTSSKVFGLTVVLWFVFTFLGSYSSTFNLPVGLFPYRFWLLLAIPLCIYSAEWWDDEHFMKWKKFGVGVICVLILITSGTFKYINNTNEWRWGRFWNETEKDGYVWLRENFAPKTKIFTFVDNHFVIGQDMHADFWTDEYEATFADAFEQPIPKFYENLKANGYQYLIIGARGIRHYGIPAAQSKLRSLLRSGYFEIEYKLNNTFFVLKVS